MPSQLISIGKTHAVRPEKIEGIHHLGRKVFVTGPEICPFGQKDRIEVRFKTRGEATIYYEQLLFAVNSYLAGLQSADAQAQPVPAIPEPAQA